MAEGDFSKYRMLPAEHLAQAERLLAEVIEFHEGKTVPLDLRLQMADLHVQIAKTQLADLARWGRYPSVR